MPWIFGEFYDINEMGIIRCTMQYIPVCETAINTSMWNCNYIPENLNNIIDFGGGFVTQCSV